MKKPYPFIAILLILTACQNPNLGTNLPNSNQNKSSQQQGNQITKVSPSHTTTQVGGIKVEGVVDINSLQKNKNPQNAPTTTLLDKKGMFISANGFTPSEVEVPVGKELMIFNGGSTEFKIISSNKNCAEFGDGLIIKSQETKTIIFKESKECPLENVINPVQKALIKVLQPAQ